MKTLSVIICIALLIPTSFSFGQDPARNYYQEGQLAAQLEYSGSGATLGGLVCGFALGLIGWGLGFLIVSASDVDVPVQLTMNMELGQRTQFEMGYTTYVKKTRKGKYNIGAGIGTLGAVIFVSSATQ